MKIRFENGKIVHLPGLSNPEDVAVVFELKDVGKRAYDQLLNKYPPGVERNRLVYGIWCDGSGEAIRVSNKEDNVVEISWRKPIENEMKENDESVSEIVCCQMGDQQIAGDPGKWVWWDKKFNCGFGGVEGVPFILYTSNYIYFPVCYDGSEWVESVPRHPDDSWTPRHFGGG